MVEKAGIHREDLDIVEVIEFDSEIEGKQIVVYRARVRISDEHHEITWEAAASWWSREG